MLPSTEPGFCIFRSGRRPVRLTELLAGVSAAIADRGPNTTLENVLTDLLRCGELECSLCDAGLPIAGLAGQLTDVLAEIAVHHRGDHNRATALRQYSECLPLCLRLQESAGPATQTVTLSTPEGFAYYALHPLDFADLIERDRIFPTTAFVVGIRSIGTTLSAVVAAALRARGSTVIRTTVRPTGHPYDRQCDLDAEQRMAVTRAAENGTQFLICDEGPGRSGSSFLSVAEALERAGVPREKIALLCAHQPDLLALCAPGAMQRWRRHDVHAVGLTTRLPHDVGAYLGGGDWRNYFLPAEDHWPAAWSQMERLKYFTSDGRALLKFNGHGHYGEQIHRRDQALADAGFGPVCLGQEEGFGRSAISEGRPGQSAELNRELLLRMAEYCAWRATAFARPNAETGDLGQMLRENLKAAFGVDLSLTMPLEVPVIADSRMQPHKWLRTGGDRWLKLDGAIHGDDHFFPGPCDIAWDLAGLCVEWDLTPEARQALFSKYTRRSRDNVSSRLPHYELAYAVFRMAWTGMAASTVTGTADEARMRAEHRFYRAAVEKRLAAIPEFRKASYA